LVKIRNSYKICRESPPSVCSQPQILGSKNKQQITPEPFEHLANGDGRLVKVIDSRKLIILGLSTAGKLYGLCHIRLFGRLG